MTGGIKRERGELLSLCLPPKRVFFDIDDRGMISFSLSVTAQWAIALTIFTAGRDWETPPHRPEIYYSGVASHYPGAEREKREWGEGDSYR